MVLEVQDQVGLETEVRLNCQKCISNNCSLVQKTNNNTCTTHTKAQRKFLTSELNYQAVLATYYTGSTVGNLQFIYSSLGLDNLKNWEYLHYRNCEDVQEQILKFTEEIVSRSLVSEIIETMKLKYNMTIKQVNDFFSNTKRKTKDSLTIGIDVSFDMGWQKRSSGRSYDSRSGHAFLIGCHTQKVISQIIYSKNCRICAAHNKKTKKTKQQTPCLPHRCPNNYNEKSSKGMESDAAVAMCTHVHNKFQGKVYISNFISDDDASTRKLLTNSPGNPLLPQDFATPTFLADLNHRIKCLAKPVFGLASLSKKISRVTRADALRIKRNYAWYFKSCIQNTQCNFKQFKDGCKAPLHHHFGEHHWCNSDWCWAKKLDDMEEGEVDMMEIERCVEVDEVNDVSVVDVVEEEEEDYFTEDDDDYREEDEEEDDILDYDEDDTQKFMNRATYFSADPSAALFDGFTAEQNKKAKEMISNKADGRYRDMVKDKDMFDQIFVAVEPFLTSVALKQIWHSYSTNINENMNHVVATYAPKHCHFSSSLSLATRVSLAAGTQVIGHLPYWSMLLHRQGIAMHPSVKSYLKERDSKRERQCKLQSTAESKLRRTAKLRETIQQEIAADNKAKKEGKTYTSSSGIDVKAAEKAVEEAMKARRTKLRDNNEPLTKKCRYYPYLCDGVDHQSAASPKCKMHSKTKPERDAALKKIKEILVDEHIQKQGEGKLQYLR
jgi:hypothetical protein